MRFRGARWAITRWGATVTAIGSRPWVLDALAVLAVVLLAALARFGSLMNIGLRGDEAVYAGQAGMLAGDQELSRYFLPISRGNTNFLLYQYIVALAYRLAGVGEAPARVVSVIFSTLTVPVLLELGRTLYSKRVGYIAAVALALSGYSVGLGRLALLDATLVFFFVLALLFAAKWVRTGQAAWLYGGAAIAALAMQVKVTGVLAVMAFVAFLAITGQYRALDRRTVALSAMAFLVCSPLAFLMFIRHGSLFVEFLSQSIRRESRVPWYYYGRLLLSYEGYLIPLLWVPGLLLALWRRSLGDLFVLLWASVVLAFFQVYPLKAFNYLLPLVPALCLLTARLIDTIAQRLAWKPAMVGSMVAGLVVLGAPQVYAQWRVDEYAGLREASYWLQANTPPDAGVMTLSRGSAQYVISFYAHRDAYPFGRFRLATILPGGVVVPPRLVAEGTPRDWVSGWPQRLIENRMVDYLVFYTSAGDDPPDDPIVQTSTQRLFRDLIEAYDGELVHSVYYNHEPRVWIYRVRKIQASPTVALSMERDQPMVDGYGFLKNSHVRLYYNRQPLGTFPTDAEGAFTARFSLPARISPSYYLVVVDDAGNYASTTGKSLWGDRVRPPNTPDSHGNTPSELAH